MEAAITLPAGPTAGLFTELGGAMFGRAARIMGEGAAAAETAERLFVRFLVHGDAQGLDARGRWNWIYRVVTSHSLRQLPDSARPGAPLSIPGYPGHPDSPRGAPPEMAVLRRLDEATQSMVVLARLDGLTAEEIAEVLAIPVERVKKRLSAFDASAAGIGTSTGGDHPSTLTLDRDRAAHLAHLGSCAYCCAVVNESDRLNARFAADIAPAAVPRVAAAVRAERATQSTGIRWKRLLWLGGGLVLVAALALLVARPRSPTRAEVPYAGLKGASRAKVAGIQITVASGAEVRPLDPSTGLRPGDRLYFRIRAEGPEYVELRILDPEGDRRLFPVGPGDAVLVRPGQALDAEYVVSPAILGTTSSRDATAGGASIQKIWVVGRFADHPFPLDRAPIADMLVVPVRIDVQP